jgi:hypothetical protein
MGRGAEVMEDTFMQETLRLETTVLPGHRVEVCDPRFPEGARVEVIVMVPEQPRPHRIPMWEFVKSLPAGPRAFPTWEEYERYLQEEKDAWER